MLKQIIGKLQTGKNFATGLITGVLLTATVATAFAATPIKEALVSFYNDITIYVNGSLFQSSVKDAKGEPVYPLVYEGRTYLPIAAIAEAFDVPAAWDGATRSIYLGTKAGETQYMTDILPAYENNGTAYSTGVTYEEYSAVKSIADSGKTKKFALGGVDYTDGFIFDNRTSIWTADVWAVWNLNGHYSNLTATLCHVDGKGDGATTVEVYFDDVLHRTIEVKPDMAPQEFTLNLNGINQLKIILTKNNDTAGAAYGFGNPELK
ncbi:MAG: copper amine oxidase N-terminal domain-containing protein [Oscillospiraceae bacterium]|jgi:hypothetical protein|nr:copper amine oxidase N-terminal domain-containing protein [Oscillospiraceae bacterium]